MFSFRKTHQSEKARAGNFQTPRGMVKTPCFMPVGTRGSVKGLTPDQLHDMGSQIILANTFHLHLRPGEKLIEDLGELHQFMGYDGPILTDSGGFQVFSLTDLRNITEEGVHFKSPIDGAKCFISPEIAMEIQRALGSNIAMAFDECPPHDMDGKVLTDSTDLTLRWLERCLSVNLKSHQCIFPIVQGGMNRDLRVSSAERTIAIKPDAVGFAVGGLAVGESRATTYEMLETSIQVLPQDRPRYMMGIGTPEDLVWAVDRGVDMFDCVLPTRNARNARVFAEGGFLNLRNAKFKTDGAPIAENCDCYTCRSRFSRGYLHHLHKVGEMLAGILCSIHNLRWLIRQCEEMRVAIEENRWNDYKAEFFAKNPHVPNSP